MLSNTMVTAVIRTYKRAKLVGRAIESVLDQTFENFELIVIDDCSPDNTSEVVQRYVDMDHRIRYIRNKIKKGHIVNLNISNKIARGKYIAYLDDDDIWLPKKLELQVARMEEKGEEYGLITGGVRYINGDTNKVMKVFIPRVDGYVYKRMLIEGGGTTLGPPSVIMLRSSAIRNIGDFSEKMPRGAGQDYFRRMAKKFKVTSVQDLCLDYYVHSKSITSHKSKEDFLNEIKARKIKLKHIEKDLEKLPYPYARELILLGNFYCLYDQLKNGRQHFFNAYKVNGMSLRLALHFIASYMGYSFYKSIFSPGKGFLSLMSRVKSKFITKLNVEDQGGIKNVK